MRGLPLILALFSRFVLGLSSLISVGNESQSLRVVPWNHKFSQLSHVDGFLVLEPQLLSPSINNSSAPFVSSEDLCSPLSVPSQQHVNGKYVLVKFPRYRPCSVEEIVLTLRHGGALGVLLFAGYDYVEIGYQPYLPLLSDIPAAAVSTVLAFEIGRKDGVRLHDRLVKGQQLYVAGSVRGGTTGWDRICAPGGALRLSCTWVLPALQLALLGLIGYRWWKFIQVKGLKCSLPQVTFAISALSCVQRVMALLWDGCWCHFSQSGIVTWVMLTVGVPVLLAPTFAVSLFFKGVVSATKGRSPLRRFAKPLVVGSVFFTLLDVTSSLLRAYNPASPGAMITGTLYFLLIISLIVFFVRSSTHLLRTLQASSAAATTTSPTAATAAGAAVGNAASPPLLASPTAGADAVSLSAHEVTPKPQQQQQQQRKHSPLSLRSATSGGRSLSLSRRGTRRGNRKNRRMAKWMLGVAAALMLNFVGLALFAAISGRSPFGKMAAFLTYWSSQTALAATIVMVFALPSSSAASGGRGVGSVMRTAARYTVRPRGGSVVAPAPADAQ